jgi:hypothetical protein
MMTQNLVHASKRLRHLKLPLVSGVRTMGITFSTCLRSSEGVRPRFQSQKYEVPSQLGVGAIIGHQYRGTTLLSLPTELIEMVVQEMEDDDVYSLSLLSRRLHSVALPIFISRQPGFFEFERLQLSKSPLKMLRAARVALFVQHLDHVTVNLTPMEPVLPMLKSLGRLFSRIEYVGSISLQSLTFGNTLDTKQVVKGLVPFMEALQEKSCTTLRMSGITFPSERKGGQRIEISPLTTLTTFDLHYSMLANLSIRNWIIRTINMSPITTLCLNRVTFSAEKLSLGKDLSLLTLPFLTELSIIVLDNLQFDDVSAFLCRHRGISNLTFKCDTIINSSTPPLPKDALPLLDTLQATPQYIQHFLRPRDSLPNLRHVDLDPDFPLRSERIEPFPTERLADVEDTLACLALRDGITSLGFFLPLDGTAITWLTRRCHPQGGKRMDVERSLVHIKYLELHTALRFLINAETISLIPKWLSLFPSLQYANFSNMLGLRSSDGEFFLRAVAEACPGIQTLQLGFVDRSAADLRQGTEQ